MRSLISIFPHQRQSWVRIRYLASAISLLPHVLPNLLRQQRYRALFRDMCAFAQELPDRLQSPVVQSLVELSESNGSTYRDSFNEDAIRYLADFAVYLCYQESLGFCLQRSLTRYVFLRHAGLPLQIHFGARKVGLELDMQLVGHAWLTIDNMPYYEEGERWRDFAIMLSFPEEEIKPAP